MVGAHVAVKAVLHQRPHDGVNVHVAARGDMSVFVKVDLIRVFELPQVREIDAVGVFGGEFGQVVEPPRAERARAESDTVMGVRHGGKHTVVIFLAAHDARQAEHIPRRIVGVDGHIDAGLVAGGHDPFQEIDQIFKQFLVRHARVGGEQSVEFVLVITLVPARQREVFGVEFHQGVVAVGKGSGAVGVLEIEVGAQPVEHGHKVVADALHAHLAAVEDILPVGRDILVPRGAAEFDILVHRHRLDHFHLQPRLVAKRLEALQAFKRPDLAHGHVVNGGNYTRHALYLLDVVEGDAILFPIPAKSHFHIGFVPPCYCCALPRASRRCRRARLAFLIKIIAPAPARCQ